MVLCHLCHIYGIWRSKGGGRFEVIWRVAMQTSRRGCNFNGRRVGSHYMQYCCVEPLLLGNVKDFIGYLLSLNNCCFTCFVSTEIDKAKSAS